MVLPFEPLFFGFRPRPRRCASRSVNAIRFGGQLLARQLIERDALANDPGNRYLARLDPKQGNQSMGMWRL